jgi:hypothetical protein
MTTKYGFRCAWAAALLMLGCGGGNNASVSWNNSSVGGSTLGSSAGTAGGSGGAATVGSSGSGNAAGAMGAAASGTGTGSTGSPADSGSTGSSGGSAGGSSGSGSGTVSGGGTTAAACSTLALCDDFESSTAGGPPDATRWSVGGPNCFSGTGRATVDATVAHSGKQSVRIDPGSDYCGHAFIQNSAIGTLGAVRFGRFYIRLAQALSDAHVTLVSMHEANDSSSGNSQELRIGGQSGILMWNRSKDDATLPELSPVGISKSTPIAALTWTCIEFAIDQTTGGIQTWGNGVAVEALLADGTPTADVDRQWVNNYTGWRPKLTDLKLGWEAYGGATNTVWIDDVAVSESRIGCTTP